MALMKTKMGEFSSETIQKNLERMPNFYKGGSKNTCLFFCESDKLELNKNI